MNVSFIQLPAFASNWSAARLTDEDLQALERLLRVDPERGQVMSGTGGIRKVRFAPPTRGTGKSGAFRVGYAYIRVADTIYWLAIFGKSEKANFTAAEKAELRRLSSRLAELHRIPERTEK